MNGSSNGLGRLGERILSWFGLFLQVFSLGHWVTQQASFMLVIVHMLSMHQLARGVRTLLFTASGVITLRLGPLVVLEPSFVLIVGLAYE